MKACALLLAAGQSSRMGGVKALMPLPEYTPLAILAGLYRDAGVEHILIVSGFHADVIEAGARALNLAIVRNPQPARGMFSSVCMGLKAVPAECAYVFIHPVDVPLVRPLTPLTLLQAASGMPGFVLVPSYGGKEGHPPLLPACFTENILAHSGEGGLGAVLLKLPMRTVDVADSLILEDMDSPEDYARLQGLALCRPVLSPEEALRLLRIHDIPEKGLRHAIAVGAVAEALVTALDKAKGPPKPRAAKRDPLLAFTGGLLHDICKGQKSHERRGGELLTRLGLPTLAKLVRGHHDMAIPDAAPLGEREMIYLADKYCYGDSFVTLEERFAQKMSFYAASAAACTAIRQRLDRALGMQARLDREFHLNAADIAKDALNIPRSQRQKK